MYQDQWEQEEELDRRLLEQGQQIRDTCAENDIVGLLRRQIKQLTVADSPGYRLETAMFPMISVIGPDNNCSLLCAVKGCPTGPEAASPCCRHHRDHVDKLLGDDVDDDHDDIFEPTTAHPDFELPSAVVAMTEQQQKRSVDSTNQDCASEMVLMEKFRKEENKRRKELARKIEEEQKGKMGEVDKKGNGHNATVNSKKGGPEKVKTVQRSKQVQGNEKKTTVQINVRNKGDGRAKTTSQLTNCGDGHVQKKQDGPARTGDFLQGGKKRAAGLQPPPQQHLMTKFLKVADGAEARPLPASSSSFKMPFPLATTTETPLPSAAASPVAKSVALASLRTRQTLDRLSSRSRAQRKLVAESGVPSLPAPPKEKQADFGRKSEPTAAKTTLSSGSSSITALSVAATGAQSVNAAASGTVTKIQQQPSSTVTNTKTPVVETACSSDRAIAERTKHEEKAHRKKQKRDAQFARFVEWGRQIAEEPWNPTQSEATEGKD